MSSDQSVSTVDRIRTHFRDTIRKVAVDGFNDGCTAAADMLAEPAAATWLARETGLPVERCRAVLPRMRDMMIAVGPHQPSGEPE